MPWCQDKKEWVKFGDCRECSRLIEVEGFGTMCEHNWRWEVEVAEATARRGDSINNYRTWDILRGRPGFSNLVRDHDRQEYEYQMRTRQLSEQSSGEINRNQRRIEEEYRQRLVNPRGPKITRVVDKR